MILMVKNSARELMLNDLLEIQHQLDQLEVQLTKNVLATCSQLIEMQTNSITECEEKIAQLEKRILDIKDKKPRTAIVKPFQLKYS